MTNHQTSIFGSICSQPLPSEATLNHGLETWTMKTEYEVKLGTSAPRVRRGAGAYCGGRPPTACYVKFGSVA